VFVALGDLISNCSIYIIEFKFKVCSGYVIYIVGNAIDFGNILWQFGKIQITEEEWLHAFTLAYDAGRKFVEGCAKCTVSSLQLVKWLAICSIVEIKICLVSPPSWSANLFITLYWLSLLIFSCNSYACFPKFSGTGYSLPARLDEKILSGHLLRLCLEHQKLSHSSCARYNIYKVN